MPKFLCKCGETLSYSQIPCKIEYKFISDVSYDQFSGTVDAEKLYEQMKSFIECPKCKRLWFFWNGFKDQATEYTYAKQ